MTVSGHYSDESQYSYPTFAFKLDDGDFSSQSATMGEGQGFGTLLRTGDDPEDAEAFLDIDLTRRGKGRAKRARLDPSSSKFHPRTEWPMMFERDSIRLSL